MKNQILLNNLKTLPMLVKNIFHSTDTSSLNLDINKTQEAILMAIKDHQNKSMKEISRFIGLEKSSYTRSVDILVEKGYLEREINKFVCIHYSFEDYETLDFTYEIGLLIEFLQENKII